MSLFIISRDSIALVRYNVLANHAFGSPKNPRSLECLAEALSGNCCQKRRVRGPGWTTVPPAGGSYILKPAVQRGTRTWAREGNGKTGSRITNLPVAAVRRRLVVRKNTQRNLHERAANVDPRDSRTPFQLGRNDKNRTV